MTTPSETICFALLMALTILGLFSALVIEHQLHGIEAAAADHEVRLLRLERAAPPAAGRPWGCGRRPSRGSEERQIVVHNGIRG
jgi:hypothetical protein